MRQSKVTPKRTSIAAEKQAEMRKQCDIIVERAAVMMVRDVGATIPMLLDRFLTYSAAQACTQYGADDTAKRFRHLADQIERGLFDHLLISGDGQASAH